MMIKTMFFLVLVVVNAQAASAASICLPSEEGRVEAFSYNMRDVCKQVLGVDGIEGCSDMRSLLGQPHLQKEYIQSLPDIRGFYVKLKEWADVYLVELDEEIKGRKQGFTCVSMQDVDDIVERIYKERKKEFEPFYNAWLLKNYHESKCA